jgi:hypothetical protein
MYRNIIVIQITFLSVIHYSIVFISYCISYILFMVSFNIPYNRYSIKFIGAQAGVNHQVFGSFLFFIFAFGENDL